MTLAPFTAACVLLALAVIAAAGLATARAHYADNALIECDAECGVRVVERWFPHAMVLQEPQP